MLINNSILLFFFWVLVSYSFWNSLNGTLCGVWCTYILILLFVHLELGHLPHHDRQPHVNDSHPYLVATFPDPLLDFVGQLLIQQYSNRINKILINYSDHRK